jgi:hypothetical protein
MDNFEAAHAKVTIAVSVHSVVIASGPALGVTLRNASPEALPSLDLTRETLLDFGSPGARSQGRAPATVAQTRSQEHDLARQKPKPLLPFRDSPPIRDKPAFTQ